MWSDDWIDRDTVECLVRPLIEDQAVGFTVCSQWTHHGDTARISAPYPRVHIGARDVAHRPFMGTVSRSLPGQA